jgi:hypothetical protein
MAWEHERGRWIGGRKKIMDLALAHDGLRCASVTRFFFKLDEIFFERVRGHGDQLFGLGHFYYKKPVNT